jgi:hypothetical protein
MYTVVDLLFSSLPKLRGYLAIFYWWSLKYLQVINNSFKLYMENRV